MTKFGVFNIFFLLACLFVAILNGFNAARYFDAGQNGWGVWALVCVSAMIVCVNDAVTRIIVDLDNKDKDR